MRWIRPRMSPAESVMLDLIAGLLMGMSILTVSTNTRWWPHGYCGTGVNDPVQYAVGLGILGLRFAIVCATRFAVSGRDVHDAVRRN